MSEVDSKLCKICLSSNTDTGLSANPSLNKFFSQILGIHESPCSIWLCIWCKSVLKRTMKLVHRAEESQRMLSDVTMINTTNNNYNKESEIKNIFNLSYQHNEHYDIPPKKEKHKLKKSKSPKVKIKDIHFVNLNENKEIELKVKDENSTEIEIDAVKLEVIDDESIDDDHDNIDTNDDFNDNHEGIKEDDKLDRTKRKVNPKLYAKCEANNFTLKVLTYAEQVEELEAKKRTEKYLSRKFKCELCAIGFVTKDVFEEHKKRHQESHSPHACPICHLRFSTSLVLSQHLLAHERRFTCKLCAAVITRYSDSENHRLKCGLATPGVCPHCKKIFSNQNSLVQHIRGVHYEKEKKFVCSFCNQKFQSKQRLAIHTRTHTGAKPYLCELCPRAFAANSNLRNHRAAHAPARPHYCVECDKSYKTRKGLRRHLLEGATHKGRSFSCQYCLKNFTSEKLLASHIATSHIKETEPCGPCNKTSNLQVGTNSKKHIQTAQESPIT